MPARWVRSILVSLLTLGSLSASLDAHGQVPRSAYLEYLERTADEGWMAYPRMIADWKATAQPYVLWGYNPPLEPVYLAEILGFLYTETGDATYAQRAGQILGEFGDLRGVYPEDYHTTRAEYMNGMPSMTNFFAVGPYSRAYMHIRDSGALGPSLQEKIESELAHSLDFMFHFPEWGAHNRTMLRAEALLYGVEALPDHPGAEKWRQMAEVLAEDNLGHWEIEDATIYHPVWLVSMFNYAEASGDTSWIYKHPILLYYAEYFKHFLTPARTVVDLGDADWNPEWFRWVAAFEKMASEYHDPEIRWIAQQIYEKNTGEGQPAHIGAAVSLLHAYRWADGALAAKQPTALSREVLEDVFGKKIVFRNGWEPQSTYLMVNYRDEGEGGYIDREFLRNTLSVEEEKGTHGNQDENDISILMSGGSVLLHDAGYRSGLPSGPFGAYRTDYFHNRMVVRKNKRDRYQALPEFLRHSGAYRPVRTQKIDFVTFEDVDVSRTRVMDDRTGYAWDRIVTYVKPDDFFIVVDAVKAEEEDFYTYSNLWHTQTIHEQGPHYYDTSVDSIAPRFEYEPTAILRQEKRLLIQFLANDAKDDSFYTADRHFQEEHTIYQTQSSHYLQGDYEVFVTVLRPHDADVPVSSLLSSVRLLPTADYPRSIGLEIDRDGGTSILGLKIDLDSELARENIRPRYTWELGRATFGDFETDAHVFYATVTEDSVQYAAANVLKVLYQGEALMEALPNVHGLQLDGAPDRVGYVKWRSWEEAVER